ncbi:Putative multidrug export ATP-binding/permease protein SAV1866 (plasmid) [Tsukamurella tyrosinosolvens]|uniref:ATP-binding cassette, subfamily B n=1 Tax=Tsukamurella tyrosinosolvens TaxID=57704 RepID=A0A1H4XBJ8_TSUTY|nr:ABC transporter ATP-binding protein [Tsukamurella tyrosinosolvens]KXO99812.1 multidrug ABC transporter ATP-binding protein [Tsukamurella tyrosinosolvens]SED02945.1 ATP-binding cassette, subfamily B [Tsukamurella tyrosinosolvens]VEH98176.1 Putative multidrug export ATP-binding/permease protein SAV1866 [Tsukamurella tyrosinosolvens]
MTLLRLIAAHLRPYRPWLLAVAAFQLVSVVANLVLPSINAKIIDLGVTTGDTGYIWRMGGIMLAITLFQVVAAGGATYFASRSAMAFGRDTRRSLFGRVRTFSGREVSGFGAASLITRTTNDVQQVQLLVLMTLSMMIQAPFMAVGGVFMALREEPGLAWLMVVAVPVLGAVLGVVIAKMIPGFRVVQTRLDAVNQVLREQLTGVRVIRAFVREPVERERFDGANTALTGASIRVMRLMAVMFPWVMLVLNLSTVAVWWFGAHLIADGTAQIGSVTAYMQYMMQILMSVMMATFMVMTVPRASVAAERITDVLTTTSTVAPPERPDPLPAITGTVELDDVTMCYQGAAKPVLQNVNLSARPGETVAIIGSTGSGKSTLINLLARLFDATAGAVRYDGVDVRDLRADALWGHVGLVPQRGYLFSGTVASNLRFGNPDATDDELAEALRIAQAEGFVAELGGLDAPIAQGGTNVSGGQRQRLAIARALVAKPAIYLFDDSFSALDLATDAKLRAALRPYTREATVFIVGQRISTIAGADQILVLEDGEVVGHGTHAELLETCPTYQEIAGSQATAGSAA